MFAISVKSFLRTPAATAPLLLAGFTMVAGASSDVVVQESPGAPVDVVFASVDIDPDRPPSYTVTLRNSGRKKIRQVNLRWAAISDSGTTLSEDVVRYRPPRPLEPAKTLRQRAGAVRPRVAPHHFSVTVDEVEFKDGTLWPARAQLARIRSAAEKGEAWAWFELGQMYRNGRQVPRDPILACVWLDLSATAGNDQARRMSDDLKTTMTAAEIEEAARLTRTEVMEFFQGLFE